MIIGDIIRRNAKRYPKKAALIFGNSRYTFEELNSRVNSLVNGLIALGLNKGDRIAVLLDSCPQFVELYCAAGKGGLVLVPLNCRLSSQDLTYLVNNAEANTLVLGANYLSLLDSMRFDLKIVKNFIIVGGNDKGMTSYDDLLSQHPSNEPNLEIREEDLVYLLYTSGTTGLPKGIMHTHKTILACMLNYMVMAGVKRDDVSLAVCPPFWGPILVFHTFPHFYMGASIVLLKDFDSKIVLETIEREKVTTTFLIPPQIVSIVDYPHLDKYNTRSLRYVLFGGIPLSPEVLKRAAAAFGNIFNNAYGLIEETPVSILPAEDMILEGSPQEVKRLASCGREAINVEVRVVDDYGRDIAPGETGEVIARGDNMMKGYWKLPQVTEEAFRGGYLHTGDLATVDTEGYIYLIGRKKDVITSGGKAIYPTEVEEVIYHHPSISEATVFGIPDERLGEVSVAVVVVKEGKKVTSEEVMALCQQNLPSYAVPSSVVLADSLPRSPTGKVLRRLLQEKYSSTA